MDEEDEISSDELRSISAEIASLFPPPRAGTELVLVDVAPHRAHAWWNIDLENFRGAGERAGGAGSPLVIRLHDVTGIDFDGKNPHDTNDTIVSGLQGQTDLNVWKDGRSYLAELGFRKADGHLERLATSERIDMPCAPAMPAVVAQRIASDVDDIIDEARVEMAGIAEAAGHSHHVAAVPQETSPASVGPWPDEHELSELLPPRGESVDAWYVKTVAAASAITIAHQSMEDDVGKIVVDFGAPQHDAPAIAGTVPDSRATPVSMHEAICEHAPDAGAIRLEEFLTCSSHNLGREDAEVEICIDVVIRGRIPAGRRASLFGREIPVDSEGRFVLKRELPHPGPLLPYIVPLSMQSGG